MLISAFNQQKFNIRFEWGEHGVAQLAPISDVVVIVDVLSSTTCVDVAVSQGATIFPYRDTLENLPAYAASVNADWAEKKRTTGKYTLSPTSLNTIPLGTRLVLPSPNGSTLTLAAKPTPVLAGCLRNAKAVARPRPKWARALASSPLENAGGRITASARLLKTCWEPELFSII